MSPETAPDSSPDSSPATAPDSSPDSSPATDADTQTAALTTGLPKGPASWLAWGALASLSVWLLFENLLLALEAAFAVDEMQYAHGAWLLARGEVIYRDFFEHHFPFLHQLLSVLWWGSTDDPTHILSLRLAMLPIFVLAIGAAVWINRRQDRHLAALAIPVLLAIPTLSAMQTQIRPDALAGALLLLTLAILGASGLDARKRGFAAGLVFALVLWTTLKTVFFGLPFVAAWVADLARFVRQRQEPEEAREPEYLLAHPLFFLAGSGAVGLGVLIHLLIRGNLGDFFSWAVLYNFDHQAVYPGFPWWRNFGQLLQHSPWLLVAGGVGVVATVRRCREGGPPSDWLLLATLFSTFLSFAWQTAPYLYSLVPFTLVLAVFAARGLAAVIRWATDSQARQEATGVFVLVLLCLWAVGEARRTGTAFERLRESSNAQQLQTLARLGTLTHVDDPVFHQWAGQVARPAPHFFHFLEASTWILRGEELRTELVRSMIDGGVPVFYVHTLFAKLPAELRAYVLERFHPLDEELWIYGQRFERGADGRIVGTFDAIRADRYFVHPPEAARHLRLGGRPVGTPLLELGKGRFPVEVGPGDAGDAAAGVAEGVPEELYILWLPRDGKPFEPRPELKERWRARSPDLD